MMLWRPVMQYWQLLYWTTQLNTMLIDDYFLLTHWGWVTHICVGKLTIIGSDNGLWPEQRQAIIWTNAGILLIGPLGTNFSEVLIQSQTFSLKKMHLKMPSAKCCSFRLGLNVLKLNHNKQPRVHPWRHFMGSRHQMETFSALLAICAGNSPGTGEFPTQRPVT